MGNGVDTEFQVVEALSTTAAQQSAAVDEKQSRSTRTATPPRTSLPLIPLAPAQKRSRSRSLDANIALGPSASGVPKVRVHQPPGQKGHPEASENRGSSGASLNPDREIRQRKSAPEQRAALEKALRASKSAPDLGAKALAAIRSIQAGTLQLDRRMQSKIAAAAKRVLEARELKRKASRDISAGAAAAGQGETAAAAAPPPQSPGALAQPPQRSPTARLSETSSPQEGWLPLPQSLSTAAAIARGEPPAIARGVSSPPQAPVEGGLAAGGSAKFHRPVPGLSMQAGTAATTAAHRPFTVTTGVPRFARGAPLSRSVCSPDGRCCPYRQGLQAAPACIDTFSGGWCYAVAGNVTAVLCATDRAQPLSGLTACKE